jgi:ankyrin repeat protein
MAEVLDSNASVVTRILSVSELFREDALRGGNSLVDLSFRVEEKGSLLMLLIDTFQSLVERHADHDAEDKEAKRMEKAKELLESVLPHICGLIRSSYDTTIKRLHGAESRDALAVLVCSCYPTDMGHWSYSLAEALLDRGADVNTRFGNGWTPLISWCEDQQPIPSGCGALLLLNRGADIDARDDEGMTAMHCLADDAQVEVCKGLADAGWLAAADLTLLNNKGETALQIAQRKLAENATNGDKRSICNMLHAHALLWKTEARPVVFRWLSHSLMLPDLANIVLSFMDGRERA